MNNKQISFDHIHLISPNPERTAQWYVEKLGAEIKASYEIRLAPQISVDVGGITLLIRRAREGELPSAPKSMQHFADFSSHNEWGTDHFGFTYHGDLCKFCEELKSKGCEFAVEVWEFTPGNRICYLAAPDGVSIEIVEGKYSVTEWWSQAGSNRRPLQCHCSALPAELWPLRSRADYNDHDSDLTFLKLKFSPSSVKRFRFLL